VGYVKRRFQEVADRFIITKMQDCVLARYDQKFTDDDEEKKMNPAFKGRCINRFP
jgi:hypothetical protein